MTFTSVLFFIFLPITVLAYFIIPKGMKTVWLLFCSYLFYFCQHQAMPLYLLGATAVTYLSARLVDIKQTNSTLKKIILAISVAVLIGGLCTFKYVDLSAIGLFMPIGVSFFTFQALSYIIDVYRGEMGAEKNFIKVALFVSFFPVILSGPIQRGKSFMPQLEKSFEFDTERVKNGLFYMLWGYFLKIVIAGRLAIMTTQVFGGFENYSGSMLLVTALFYAFNIYCDFAGYSFIAIGVGRILGFDHGINFRQPYLSGNVGEFWRRWHISLSSWFRDYLYIPLGGSRKGTLRKYLNVLIVFAISGIWHGNTINFLIWGFLNGFYQVLGQILKPVRAFLVKITQSFVSEGCRRVLAVIGCFILLDFTWIFFAIPSFGDALKIITKIFTAFSPADLINGSVFGLGLGTMNLLFVVGAILILIVMDVICERRKCDITGVLPLMKTGFRWIVYYALIAMILMSVNLSTREFIYSQF